jgi:hypothetical protein
MTTIPKTVATFADLVEWLVRERHDGVWYAMAKALGVSSGLPYQWRDKTVKAPSPGTILRLCEVYGLPFRGVWDLLIPSDPSVAPPPTGGKAPQRPRTPKGTSGTRRPGSKHYVNWPAAVVFVHADAAA